MIKHPRFGIHYFPDTLHYRQSDLEMWLPELTGLGVSWLALQSPLQRAIPETFVSGLIKAGIQPLLHFSLPLVAPIDLEAVRLLFRSYAAWGVRYVILFDRPNLRSSWPASAWMQVELVERFLDLYLPVAELAVAHDLTPLFPPLQPGGDYWDLAFLRAALGSLKRRQSERWLGKLALAAYAGSGTRPLDWGAGGVQRWPGARPYQFQPGMQDQRGLHIYEWYLPLCEEALGRTLPLYLLGMGSYPDDVLGSQPGAGSAEEEVDERLHTERTLDILTHLEPDSEDAPCQRLPGEIKAGCLWLLAAEPESGLSGQGWYQVSQDGVEPRLVAQTVRSWANSEKVVKSQSIPKSVSDVGRKISHYILLPLYAWGAAQWDLAHIAPLLEKDHPTVGFSLEEASLATRVTVVGKNAFSPQALEFLRQAGCIVEQLGDESGTLCATQRER